MLHQVRSYLGRHEKRHNSYPRTHPVKHLRVLRYGSNELSYRVEIDYVEQPEPLFTFVIESTLSHRVHTVTVEIKNASGSYDYSYVSGDAHCEGHLLAQHTTTDLANFDVITSNMEEAAQIFVNDIINEYCLATIDILSKNYFPPNLGFTIKHFGFEL